MHQQSSQIHQFGNITVDPVSMRVLKGSEPVALEPKSFKVLLYLIENRDRLVTKEELLKSIWQDTFVSDNALTRSVAQIRKALGDDARQGRIIETVPRLGYRFIAVPGPITSPNRDETVMAPAIHTKRWLYLLAAIVIVVGSGIAAKRWIFPSPVVAINLALPVQVRTAQFTTSSGLDIYPSFKPDGTALAYSSDESGTFEIYVKGLSAQPRQVTADGKQNVQPSWSPDGGRIVYHSLLNGGLWVVSAQGGQPRKLTDFGSAPSWSPDGTMVAFHGKSLSSLSAVDLNCGVITTGVWVVPADGGPANRVPMNDDPRVCQNADPSWTSDGRITFSRQYRGWTLISSVKPDGQDLRTLEKVPGLAINPYWDPVGRSIYYSNFSPGGDFTLRRVPVDAKGQRTGSTEEMVGQGVSVPRTMAISRDGKRMAYTASLPVSRIESLALGPGFQPTGPPVPVTTQNIYRYTQPYVSPDGQHLAYTLWRKGSNGDIWVSDIDGRNPKLLSSAPNNSLCAGWLPDSSAVIYVKYASTGSQLYAASLRDGSERHLAPAAVDASFPALSPDGRFFVLHGRYGNGSQSLRKLELATGRTTDLVAAEGVSAGFGIWSRDGKSVAFEIQNGDDTQLAIVGADGGPYTVWTTGRGKTWPGSWSADGNTIISAARRDGIWNVWAIDWDHSEKKLTNYTSMREYVRYPRLSPKGDRVVYEYNETRGNIYVGEFR